MQIRSRKHSISLIRSIYDDNRKRCRAVTLGTLPRNVRHIPLEIWEKLTEPERAQMNALCAENQARADAELREVTAWGLPETLRQAAAWYRSQSKVRTQLGEMARLAEASRAEWTEVLAAMCDAGVGRTRKRGKS